MGIFACISHKGGTGRTVTSANVAYRLARSGNDVCMIDFDLASPTLGSVIGLEDIGAGAERGIHHLLIGEVPVGSAESLERNAWESEHIADTFDYDWHGRFHLLPGSRSGADINVARAGGVVADLLTDLNARYDVVLVDLRSGLGPVVELFLGDHIDELLTGWLIFHRWTSQHLVGVGNLLENLHNFSDGPFHRIRTAVIDPATAGAAAPWVQSQHERLQKRANDLFASGVSNSSEIGAVPMDPLLQWSEMIVTDADAEVVNNHRTVSAFAHLAERVASL